MKMNHVSRRLRRFLRTDKAVSALEYAILVGVIAVAAAAALTLFGTEISTAIQNIGSRVASDAMNVQTAGTP